MVVNPGLTRPRAAVFAAACGAWVAGCSADVDGYHLATSGFGGGSGGNDGSGGGATVGGARSGSGGSTSAGGRTGLLTTGGAAGTGGDTGSGGAASWPGNPVVVLASPAPTGITAAAWEPTSKHFFLLKSAAKEIYELDPATAEVTGPFSVPGTKVAPHPFGASASHFYVVADNTIHRIPRAAGGTTSVALSVASVSDTLWTGAYASGWFVVGHSSGATQALQDGTTVLNTPAKSLTKVNGIATDGANLVFTTPSTSTPEAWVKSLAVGSFSLPPGHCMLPNGTYVGAPVSVYGTTVAWVLQNSVNYHLNFATLSSTACSSPVQITFGAASAASRAVGLLDDRYAIVTTVAVAPTVTMAIEDSVNGGPRGSSASGSIGTGSPDRFVMGTDTPTHYALLVTRDRPLLVSF